MTNLCRQSLRSVGSFVVASMLAALPAPASLLVTGQSGILQAAGQNGLTSLTAPADEVWAEQVTSGNGTSEWTGFAQITSTWTPHEAIIIEGSADITPGPGQPIWTRGLVDVAVDFTLVESTDVIYAQAFSFSLSPRPPEDATAIQLVNLMTNEIVQAGGSFEPLTLGPGSYRLSLNLQLGNLQSAPEAFSRSIRTASATIAVVPSPWAGSVALLAFAALARRRR